MKYEAIEGYEEYREDGGYGFFGYPGAMADRAIRRDDATAIKKMLEYGWINKDTKTMDNLTMVQYCDRQNAKKCAKLFAA